MEHAFLTGRSRPRRALTWGAIVAVIACASCSEDILARFTFPCDDDAMCAPGYHCEPVLKVCVSGPADGDVVQSDAHDDVEVEVEATQEAIGDGTTATEATPDSAPEADSDGETAPSACAGLALYHGGRSLSEGMACGTGVCAGGTMTCQVGVLGCSTDHLASTVEVCTNGLDDDCDGYRDEGCLPFAVDADGDGVPEGEDCSDRDSGVLTNNVRPERCCAPTAIGVPMLEAECDTDCDGKVTACAVDDTDGDGFTAALGDCNDHDPRLFPGAPERCGDGVIQGCVGPDPSCEGLVDHDGDSWSSAFDCDDDVAGVNPESFEVCNGVDDNCDGLVDEGNPGGGIACGTDAGECERGLVVCSMAEGAWQCADELAAVGAEELACDGRDEDCDGETDEAFRYSGAALGFLCEGIGACAAGLVVCSESADRATCSTNPDGPDAQDTPEVCDLLDNDCDGFVNDGLTDVSASTCVKFGVCGAHPASIVAACRSSGTWQCDYAAVPGYEADEESCDGLDNDCDGTTDEAFPQLAGPCDGPDNDACAHGNVVCSTADPSKVVCDESPATLQIEICDGQDNDCDGVTDEGFDLDRDGHLTCGKDRVLGTDDDDCNDRAIWVFPGAREVCDGVLNDCRGTLPNDEIDGDSDRYLACPKYVERGAGFLGGGDCAATRSDTYPGASEPCDGTDNNCDGRRDEPFDLDRDGVSTCGPDGVTGTGDEDCDDGERRRRPGRSETCDAIDNDCDGATDGADPDYDATDADQDGDNAVLCGGTDCDDGDADVNRDDVDNDGVDSCGADGLPNSLDEDCDDHDVRVFPGQAEACDGVDNDCDGLTDADDGGMVADFDGDQAVSACLDGPDCDDLDAHVVPELAYTSGIIRACEIALSPGGPTSWKWGFVEQPMVFRDPVSGLYYLYFRGHYSAAGEAFGVAESVDGRTWEEYAGNPILAANAAPLAWDNDLMHYPSVVHVPALAVPLSQGGVILRATQRPYVMYYVSPTITAPNRWTIGIATATSPTGPYDRLDPMGAPVIDPVITFGPSGAYDDFALTHPVPRWDPETARVDLWYSGQRNSDGVYRLLHASSVDGVAFTRSDVDGVAGQDVVIDAGPAGAFDATAILFATMIENADPTAVNAPFEFWFNGSDNRGIGYALGNATSVAKGIRNPIFLPATQPLRFDHQRVNRLSARFEADLSAKAPVGAGTYRFVYSGRTAAIPGELAANPFLDGTVAYVGQAWNAAPEPTFDFDAGRVLAPTAPLHGWIRDTAPERVTVTVRALVPGHEISLGPASVEPGNPALFSEQTVRWTLASAELPLDTFALLVQAIDEAGVRRSSVVAVTVEVP